MSNQTNTVAPLVGAFIVVYVLAVAICGVLVDGTIALAVVVVALMAAVATFIGVEFFRHIDGD